MKKVLIFAIGIVVLGVLGAMVWITEKGAVPEEVACTMEAKLCPDGSYVGRTGPWCEFAPCSPDVPAADVPVRVASPLPQGVVTSPLTVTGEARGTWYFEASFPVRLLDGDGNELAVVPAQAQGDWMTTEFVPFQVTLTFATPETATGTLVLEKDNPSGLPENAAEVRIPVRFR